MTRLSEKLAVLALSGACMAGTAGYAAGMPSKMIFFVDGQTCPAGSSLATDAAGRLLLAVSNTSNIGGTYGTPLKDQEARKHTHSGTVTVNLPSKSISGANGPNHQATGKGKHSHDLTSGGSTANLPFIQLLVCQAD